MLLAADHLIKHISSNPLRHAPAADARRRDRGPRPQALVTYLDSLRATREMDASARAPRPRRADHRPRRADRRALRACTSAARRRSAASSPSEPRTAYELAQALWGNIAVTQAYLTLCEVLGHVDLLVDRGVVVEDVRDEVVTFRPAAGG